MLLSGNCSDCDFKSYATGALSEEELVLHKANSTSVEFKAGESIFKQGTPNSHVVYIKSGLVKVHVDSPRGEQIIKIGKAPRYLGISNVLCNKVFQLSATALEPTTACFIDAAAFVQLIHRNGKFAHLLLTTVSEDELGFVQRYADQSTKQVVGRVAAAILFFAVEIYENNQFRLPITRAELAAYINATRESTARALLEMKNDGILKLEGRSVRILRPEILKEIAEKG